MPIVNPTWRLVEIIARAINPTLPLQNRYWYAIKSGNGVAASVISAGFVTDILTPIRVISSNTLLYNGVTVIDHTDPSIFGDFAVSVAGTLTSANPAATFLAMPFRLFRSTRDMRSGWKRIAGLDEVFLTGNTFISTHFTVMQGVEDVFSDIQVWGGENFTPVLIRNAPTPTDTAIDPDDPSTWRYTDIGSSAAVNRVTTQNSRKAF